MSDIESGLSNDKAILNFDSNNKQLIYKNLLNINHVTNNSTNFPRSKSEPNPSQSYEANNKFIKSSSITNNNNDNVTDYNSNINDDDNIVKTIVYVPQLFPVLFNILEKIKNSEIIEKVCNKIVRCLTPLQIDYTNTGNSKYLNKSLSKAVTSSVILSNMEAIFNQKDWLVSMCSCIVALRNRILKHHEEERDLNGNESNNYDTSDTKSEADSSINEDVSINGK